jgi:methylthioribose-1-phosphate isomerase
VLTHCNAGALATAGDGTALSIVTAAHREGKIQRVYADETRPLLQGARLTAWELVKAGIEVVLITDSTAASVLREGRVQAVIVGADRIAANGDTANKVGSYPLAVLAQRHHVPFYIAAPISTLDPGTATGESIPIEEREASEVTHFAGRRIAPDGVKVYAPAFDVTPHELVSAIVTDRGVLRPPFDAAISAVLGMP